jgi:cadmium resistance protein CadD (predicted permease)
MSFGEKVVSGFLILIGVLVVCAIVASTVADHSVRGYYVGLPYGLGFQVKAAYDWEVDDSVFVTDDINKAIDVTNRLNESLKSHPTGSGR